MLRRNDLQIRKYLRDAFTASEYAGVSDIDKDVLDSSELITIEHHAAGQMPTVLVRHGEQLPCQRLYHQPCHEVLGGVLLRQDEEDSGLLRRKLLGVGGAVEAQHLLQLRVQEGVEPGQHRGHDGGHGLFGGIQRCTGKPPGLVCIRQSVHQKCKPVFAANAGGRQQFLYQLEYGHDVSAFCGAFAIRRQEFRQQEHYGGQQALRRIVKVGVLTVVGVAVR